MSHVEITLKSGTVVMGDVSEFTVQKNALKNFAGVKWTTPQDARRMLMHVDPDEIAAIVFVDEEREEVNNGIRIPDTATS